MTTSPDPERIGTTAEAAEELRAWAASGAMALTGPPEGAPLGPPSTMVPKLAAVASRLTAQAASLGAALEVDPLALLGERAAISDLARHGATSCGGTSRLVRAGADWLAVSLARPDDVGLIPAWLEVDEPDDPWAAIEAAAALRPADDLMERALLLGLPVTRLPRAVAPSTHERAEIVRTAVAGEGAVARPLEGLVVVDLSSLWAGPLCGSLLALAGATVVKVESLARPDGARLGPAAFFDLLNAGKRSVAVDHRTREGQTALRALLARADVVIEASRPRALDQLGIDPFELLVSGPQVWASITGHGRTGAGRDRVAFGDDAAVAGGLVSWAAGEPCFCADAVADPTTGLVATAEILDALAAGGRWHLDIAMAHVAAHLAGPTLVDPDPDRVVAAPRARPAPGRAPRLGEHTAAVLDGLAR